MTHSNRLVSVTILLFSTALIVVASVFSAFWKLGYLLLIISFVTASLAIIKKQRTSYLQGKTTRGVFLRNITLEVLGVILAMILAGVFGRYIAQAVKVQISHSLIRIVMRIFIGMLVGACIGFLMKRTWGYLVKP